jgi:hypothetical protein
MVSNFQPKLFRRYFDRNFDRNFDQHELEYRFRFRSSDSKFRIAILCVLNVDTTVHCTVNSPLTFRSIFDDNISGKVENLVLIAKF